MKTMLIPVNFTATSDNAVSYAIAWSKAYDYKRIILLKTLHDTVFDNLIPSIDYVHVSQDYMAKEREEATLKLQAMYRPLMTQVAPDMKVCWAVKRAAPVAIYT